MFQSLNANYSAAYSMPILPPPPPGLRDLGGAQAASENTSADGGNSQYFALTNMLENLRGGEQAGPGHAPPPPHPGAEKPGPGHGPPPPPDAEKPGPGHAPPPPPPGAEKPGPGHAPPPPRPH